MNNSRQILKVSLALVELLLFCDSNSIEIHFIKGSLWQIKQRKNNFLVSNRDTLKGYHRIKKKEK
jgi:hypothetical protein